ncbi:MAG: hypothetical protein LLG44_11395 [Chloroflexi bacterium]|nr:hypothetical protein [Chloroflexota bacterium]
MARAAKGYNYGHIAALVSLRGSAVEKMPASARKLYLQRHLHLVESQIRLLADKLGFDEESFDREDDWTDNQLDQERWSSLINLDYLLAERDALRETLAKL